MASIKVPIIIFVIGEGGSGGALGIGVGDRIYVLENAYYSVISPEGCASILWRSADKAPEAAEATGITAESLIRLGLIEEILPEPLGGAHRDTDEMARRIFELMLRTASGEPTRIEAMGFGAQEFAPWVLGATM